MAETVSDERLAYVLGSLENRWAFVGPDEIESLLSELQSRRAADKVAPKAEPPLFDKDLVDLVCYYERYIMDNWTDTPDERCRMADATVNALTELQGYRAAEPEPEPTGAWAVKSQLEDEFDGERWRFTVEKWEDHDEPDGDCSARV